MKHRFIATRRHVRRPLLWQGSLGVLAAITLLTSPAAATHFRYGHITWVPRTDIGPRTVDFTVQNVWRRDAYTSGNDRCINVATLARQNCTGPGGAAGIGDVIHERQGGTRFDFGDGSPLVGVTISGSSALLYVVTSIDSANNWLFGFALDPTSLPAIDTTIAHTYASNGTFTAKIEDCCRISPCTSPNAHLNNPDNGFRVATDVEIGGATPDSSPVSGLPPIVLCQQNASCSFTVPMSDNELDPVTFRLSTNSEADFDFFDGSNATVPGLGQPGVTACPNSASIAGGTGLYSWNTTGCRLASSPGPNPPAGGCNNGSLNTFYSSQVMIEETSRQGAVAVDFLVQLVPLCPLFNSGGPVFGGATPVCGSTLSVNPGGTLNFAVSASDVDVNDTVTLNVTGLPAGATMTPALPNTANPASSNFSWTAPAQFGQHVMTFTATDLCSVQTICVIKIDVSQEICGDGLDNDGDTLADCADPDCNGTPCNDNLVCTVNDACQNGTCMGAPRDCSDGNACNGAETCNPASGCEAGTPPVCNDNNACNGVETCVPATGCVPGTPLSCNDGNACNGVETCDAISGCLPGTAPTCDDNNVCNGVETCNPASGCVAGTPVTCSDGLACNGVETCHPTNGCQAGAAFDCSAFADGCNDAACIEPGTCLVTPKINGFGCNDGNPCTMNDRCQAGLCVGLTDGDTDGDGYCDAQEVQAKCNKNDFLEIPPQSNTYAGGRAANAGEILLTFHAPRDRDVFPATDPSCATQGACNLTTRFCTAGRISDPCNVDSDCNLAPGICRVVINYAAVPVAVPDLTLIEVSLGLARQPKQFITPSFFPTTVGCTRKVDVTVGPAGFKKGAVRFKAKGTTGGKLRKDRDLIRYKE